MTVPLINTSGAMLFSTANAWVDAMRNRGYAGIITWTLPSPVELAALFNDLNLHPGDSWLTVQRSVGPFQNLQPFFYWACERDQAGNRQSPCNGVSPGTSQNGTPMQWSFILDSGFQATDEVTKEFYVEVYFPASSEMLPVILRP